MRFIAILICITIMLASITGCKKADTCGNVTCQNGAECVNNACQCPAGYEGNDCGTETRAQYFGSYNTVTNCNPTAYTVTISTSNLGTEYVRIDNIVNDSQVPIFGITQTGGIIDIPSQTVGNNIIYGTIYFASGNVTASITYNRNLSGINTYCNGTITKF